MDDSTNPAHVVLEVIEELRDVVFNRDERDTRTVLMGGHSCDLLPIWRSLEAALRDSEGIRTSPSPGLGLASIWLNAVQLRGERAEEAAEKLTGGINGLLFHENDDLYWLATTGWETGHRALGFALHRRHGIRSLRIDETRPLNRLRQIAAVLEGKSENVSSREVGELILLAVNDLDVNRSWFANASFCEHILNNLDFLPAIAAPPVLSTMSSGALYELVEELKAGTSDATVTPEPSSHLPHPVVDIGDLEKVCEPLSRGDGKWVTNRKAAELEGVDTETLGKYRREGQSTANQAFGRDIFGRIWRRPGTPKSHPQYQRRTLLVQK